RAALNAAVTRLEVLALAVLHGLVRAFGNDGFELVLWHAAGVETRRIVSITAASTPTPAPVGHDFSYLPPQHTLWVTTVASAASRLVAQAAPGVTWSSPAWSPDGRHLALREMAFFATTGDVQNVLAV